MLEQRDEQLIRASGSSLEQSPAHSALCHLGEPQPCRRARLPLRHSASLRMPTRGRRPRRTASSRCDGTQVRPRAAAFPPRGSTDAHALQTRILTTRRRRRRSLRHVAARGVRERGARGSSNSRSLPPTCVQRTCARALWLLSGRRPSSQWPNSHAPYPDVPTGRPHAHKHGSMHPAHIASVGCALLFSRLASDAPHRRSALRTTPLRTTPSRAMPSARRT